MSGILTIICGACGNRNNVPHNRDDWPKIKVVGPTVGDDPVLCQNCQIKRDAYQKYEEKKAKEEEEKKERKFNEWKSSHCAECGKYSNFYHYIYDSRTEKLNQSYDNATEPNKQWVFCTQEHFQSWYKKLHYKCLECCKSGLGNYIYHKNNSSIRFCSRECSRSYYAETCDNCNCKATGKSYYVDSNNKTGTLCENCFELKRLEKKLDELNASVVCKECNKLGTVADMNWYNPNTNDGKKFCSKSCCLNHYAEKCDKCNKKIGENEKSYYADGKSKTGNLCKICWEIKWEERKRNQNSSPNSPTESEQEETKPSSSPVSSNSPQPQSDDDNEPESCPSCNKAFKSKELDNHISQTPQCREVGEAYDKIVNHKERVDLSKLNLTKQGKKFLETLITIYIDEKWVDLDKLDLPSWSKESLKKAMEDLGIENSSSRNERAYKEYEPTSINEKRFWQQPWFIIGIVVILVVSLVIAIKPKNKSKKVMKKKKKKIKVK